MIGLLSLIGISSPIGLGLLIDRFGKPEIKTTLARTIFRYGSNETERDYTLTTLVEEISRISFKKKFATLFVMSVISIIMVVIAQGVFNNNEAKELDEFLSLAFVEPKKRNKGLPQITQAIGYHGQYAKESFKSL